MTHISFFNNKGGVGKTVLVSHLAWMFADRGISTLTVDLDPQSNLTSMFVTDERIEELWDHKQTISEAVRPLMERSGDISSAHIEQISQNLYMVPGNLELSRFEDLLAENWSKCLTGEVGAFRVISSFYRIIVEAAARVDAAIVLIDLGPNLGPLNRAALLASDQIILPIAPDLFSLRGMKNLGPTLRDWRTGWSKRREELQDPTLTLPSGVMNPIGYVLMSFGVRDNRPVKAYDTWLQKIPVIYRDEVLAQPSPLPSSPGEDPFQLAALKHYRSLMPLAMTARKPMFALKPADGARGAHLDAVQACYHDFYHLACRIGDQLNIQVP